MFRNLKVSLQVLHSLELGFNVSMLQIELINSLVKLYMLLLFNQFVIELLKLL